MFCLLSAYSQRRPFPRESKDFSDHNISSFMLLIINPIRTQVGVGCAQLCFEEGNTKHELREVGPQGAAPLFHYYPHSSKYAFLCGMFYFDSFLCLYIYIYIFKKILLAKVWPAKTQSQHKNPATITRKPARSRIPPLTPPSDPHAFTISRARSPIRVNSIVISSPV